MVKCRYWGITNITNRLEYFKDARTVNEIRFTSTTGIVSDNPANGFSNSVSSYDYNQSGGKAFDGTDVIAHSTFSTESNYSPTVSGNNWRIWYKFDDAVSIIDSVTIKMREQPIKWGQEWQTADIQYSHDGIKWFFYGVIKPFIKPLDNSTIHTNIMLTPRNINISNIETNLKFDNIYMRNNIRKISGKLNGYVELSLYEKYTRQLISIRVTDENGYYNFIDLCPRKSYFIVDSNHSIVYDTDYEGKENIKGFVEGVTEPVKVTLVDKHGNELQHQSTTNFEFLNYNTTNLKGSIKVGDTLTPVEYYINQQRGYISASVVITECLDSDFVIHCFRSSDKQFIGEYPIINDRYTIDNLNLTQTYDIMLHDKNKVVETQVHSRRTPSIYQ